MSDTSRNSPAEQLETAEWKAWGFLRSLEGVKERVTFPSFIPSKEPLRVQAFEQKKSSLSATKDQCFPQSFQHALKEADEIKHMSNEKDKLWVLVCASDSVSGWVGESVSE